MDKNFVETTLRKAECDGRKSLREAMDKKDKLDRFIDDPVYDSLYVLHEHANDERADIEIEIFFMDIVMELMPAIVKCGVPTIDGALKSVDEVKYREWIERAIMRYYQNKYKK